MKKSDLQKIRIDIRSGGTSALSLMVANDGSLARQGTGKLPVEETSVSGSDDGSIFSSLVDLLDDAVFQHADVYDHPDKSGIPITYSIAFLGRDDNTVVFEFRLGSETRDVGELLPYFDGFISQATALTDDWYAQEKLNTPA